MSRPRRIHRRTFLATSAAVSSELWIGGHSLAAAGATQPEPRGFFTLDKRHGRWCLITPEGNPFFSLALNHIDSTSLRYAENLDIWRQKYGNSQKRWLQEAVAPDLKSWGFNSVGWVQEVVTRADTNHRHSRNFTFEEYQWLDMPYCHMLPFADFHQWEAETRHPDFFSSGFQDWCDYVARAHCARMADDAHLIGYFYIDCPTWVHTRPPNHWKGPLFDPAKLEAEAGCRELFEMATQYYRVTHDAIRRYDKHHLILGDRYEANARVPMEVVNAARPYVDVLSFQDFREPIEHLADWHEKTGMPVLWADGAHGISAEDHSGLYHDGRYSRNDGRWYAEMLAGLRKNPGCVGAHLCGAYLRNHVRRRGLLDEQERPDDENMALIREANLQTQRWMDAFPYSEVS
jgi:hypothetical protein